MKVKTKTTTVTDEQEGLEKDVKTLIVKGKLEKIGFEFHLNYPPGTDIDMFKKEIKALGAHIESGQNFHLDLPDIGQVICNDVEVSFDKPQSRTRKFGIGGVAKLTADQQGQLYAMAQQGGRFKFIIGPMLSAPKKKTTEPLVGKSIDDPGLGERTKGGKSRSRSKTKPTGPIPDAVDPVTDKVN